MKILFATGNPNKVKNAKRNLGIEVECVDLHMPEIQSLDIREVAREKLKAAYAIAKQPVMIEDIALEFCALGRLPGTFTRFFVEELGPERMCRLIDGKDRSAIVRCVIGYSDGKETAFFEGECKGNIALFPRGSGGFINGWSSIFEADMHGGRTNGEITQEEHDVYYKMTRRYDQLRKYLNKKSSE